MSRTLEQERARHALDFIEQERDRSPAERKKMATHVHKTPIRILNHGLGQALAFLLADNGLQQQRQPAGRLYDHLQAWLCGPRDEGHPLRAYTGGEADLLRCLIQGTRQQYLLAQEESLRLFTWLCKFSDAYLGKGETE